MNKLVQALMAGIAAICKGTVSAINWITSQIAGRRGGGLPDIGTEPTVDAAALIKEAVGRTPDLTLARSQNDAFEIVRKYVKGTDISRRSADLTGVPGPVRRVLFTLSSEECKALSTAGDKAIYRLACGEVHGVLGVPEVTAEPILRLVPKLEESEFSPELRDAVEVLLANGGSRPFARPKSFGGRM